MQSNTGVKSEKMKDRWYLTAEELDFSPSRKCGLSAYQERRNKEAAAKIIQDMGVYTNTSPQCISTALVFMHRFFTRRSLTEFGPGEIAQAALLLAAKVENAINLCRDDDMVYCLPTWLKKAIVNDDNLLEDIKSHELLLLRTLDFDLHVEHPHVHIMEAFFKLGIPKELIKIARCVASNSLRFTNMCLQYKPTVVACFCIYFASVWLDIEATRTDKGRLWFHEIDSTVSLDLLKQMSMDLIYAINKSPSNLEYDLNTFESVFQEFKRTYSFYDAMLSKHSGETRETTPSMFEELKRPYSLGRVRLSKLPTAKSDTPDDSRAEVNRPFVLSSPSPSPPRRDVRAQDSTRKRKASEDGQQSTPRKKAASMLRSLSISDEQQESSFSDFTSDSSSTDLSDLEADTEQENTPEPAESADTRPPSIEGEYEPEGGQNRPNSSARSPVIKSPREGNQRTSARNSRNSVSRNESPATPTRNDTRKPILVQTLKLAALNPDEMTITPEEIIIPDKEGSGKPGMKVIKYQVVIRPRNTSWEIAKNDVDPRGPRKP